MDNARPWQQRGRDVQTKRCSSEQWKCGSPADRGSSESWEKPADKWECNDDGYLSQKRPQRGRSSIPTDSAGGKGKGKQKNSPPHDMQNAKKAKKDKQYAFNDDTNLSQEEVVRMFNDGHDDAALRDRHSTEVQDLEEEMALELERDAEEVRVRLAGALRAPPKP